MLAGARLEGCSGGIESVESNEELWSRLGGIMLAWPRSTDEIVVAVSIVACVLPGAAPLVQVLLKACAYTRERHVFGNIFFCRVDKEGRSDRDACNWLKVWPSLCLSFGA